MRRILMKTTVLLTVVALVLGCASCALFKNYDYVNEAIAKTAALDAVSLDVRTDVYATANGQSESLSSGYGIVMKGLQTNAPVFLTETNVTLYGETVPASVYYEAPYYYVKTETDSVKLETSDLIEKTDFLSDWKTTLKPLTEAMLETAEETDHENGTKTVTVFADASDFQKNYESLLKLWQEKLTAAYASAQAGSNMSVTDTKYAVTVDTVSGTVTAFSARCHIDLSAKNEAGEDVTVSAIFEHMLVYKAVGDAVSLDAPEGYADFELTDGLKLDAYKMTEKAVADALARNDFKADIDMDIAFGMSGMQMEMPTSLVLCVKGANTEDTEFHYTMTTSMLGMEITQNVYFKDGFYYMDDGVNQVKYPHDAANEKTYGYRTDLEMLLKTLPESLFEGVEVQRNADGTKTFSLAIKGGLLVRYYTDFTAMIASDTGYSLDWTDGTLTVVFERDGTLRSYALVCKANTTISGMQTAFTVKYGIDYQNDGEPVTPKVPENLEKYLSMAELNGVVFDIVSQSIDRILNADEMSVSCTMESLRTATNQDDVYLSQSYTLAANRLKTFSPVYRYIITSEVNDYTFTEDIYYENGYYYIDSDILETPCKVPEASAPSYNILAAMSVTLQKVPDAALETVATQGSKGAVCILSWEMSEEDFKTMYPSVWAVSVEDYRVTAQKLESAVLMITTDVNGNLLSYTLSYELKAELSPNFGLYLKNESLTVSETISYVFDTSGMTVVIEPPQDYQNYSAYVG